MRQHNLHFMPIFLLFFLFGTTAFTPQKATNSEAYDEILFRTIKKIEAKKKKKKKHIVIIEEAFEKANAYDMAAIAALKTATANWIKIHDLAQGIKYRQSRIYRLLPLQDEYGQEANFSFIEIDALLKESKEKVAAFFYAEANNLLKDARLGDKLAAREAYKLLKKISTYDTNYQDSKALLQEMQDLGIEHIFFTIKNRTNEVLPTSLEKKVKLTDFDSPWRKFHTHENNLQFDYKIIVNINDVVSFPILRRTVRDKDEKELTNSNEQQHYPPNRDTTLSSTPYRVFTKSVMTAWITQTWETKFVQLEGSVTYYDVRNNKLLKTKSISPCADFKRHFTTYTGKYEALSDRSLRLINTPLQEFPSDEALIAKATMKLPSEIKSVIKSFLKPPKRKK